MMTGLFLLIACLLVGKNVEDTLLKDLTIVSGIGIDIKDEEYLVTLQILNIEALQDSNSQVQGFVLYQGQGKTISEAIHQGIKSVSRFIFFDDIEMVVVSEELARTKGITEAVNFLFLEPNISSNTMFFVSKEVAASDILSISPPIRKVSSNHIIDIVKNIKQNGSFAIPTYPNRIKNLLLNAPVTNNIIPYISIVGDPEKGLSKQVQETPLPPAILSVDGMAYFKSDKLEDYLSTDESKHLIFLTKGVKGGLLEGNCPKEEPGFFTFNIEKSKTRFEIEWKEQQPTINVYVKLRGIVSEWTCKTDFQYPNLKEYEKVLEEDLNNGITEIVNKSKEVGTDFIGFGKEIYLNKPSKWHKIEKQWETLFPKVPYKIKTEVRISDTGDAAQKE